MLRWLIGSSLRLRLLILPAALGLVFLGAIQLRSTPVDALPEFSPPYVEVQTEALGLSAIEVEQLITTPLEENLLNGVGFLDDIRSESVAGLSSIELIFEPGTDILRARQLVQERLTRAKGLLPNVSKPPTMLQPLSSTNRVLMIGLSSDDLSLIDMSVLARWKIKPRLMGIPGVANVSIWGQREQQLQVQVDPAKLKANDVALSQVISTTGNALWVSPLSFLEASAPGTGGFVESPSQRLSIQHISPIKTAQDMSQVTLRDDTGRTLRLGDVADVVEDHQPLIGDAVVNDDPSLMLVIEKFPGFDTVNVSNDVEKAFAALQPGLTGIEADTTLFRPATFVESALDNLAVVLVIGLVLAIAVLVGLLFDWRSVVISVLAIAVSLVTAGLVLDALGAGFNAVALVGLVIALVIVVDDAVVQVGIVRQRLRSRATGDGASSPAAVILDSTIATREALGHATLILLLAAAPLLVIGGVTGALFGPLALSYGIAVLASTAVALLVTPPLTLLLMPSAPREPREAPPARWLRAGYAALLDRFAVRPRQVYVAVGVLALAGLAMLPLLGVRSTLPVMQDRNLLVQWEGAPGTSREAMNRLTAAATTELRATPGVRAVGAHVGRAITSDQVVGLNSAQLWVSLQPEADYASTVAAVEAVVEGYPGVDGDVMTYAEDRVNQARPVSEDRMVVRVYGEDLPVLRDKATQIQQLMAEIDGVDQLATDLPRDEPTIEIKPDLAAAQRFGIVPGDVRRAAATMLQGVEVGNLFEDQKVFEVVVVGVPAVRHNLSDVRDLLIDTPGGEQVRLGDVADVRVSANPAVIKHHAVSRRVDITATVSGRDSGDVARDIEDRLRSVHFPLEYHAEILDGYERQSDTRLRVLGFGLAAAIGIFLLLQVAVGSWRLAAALFVGLLLATVGGLVTAVATGSALAISSFAGLLAVVGVAARNGLLLVRHYQRLERDGEAVGPDLVRRGAQDHVVPIVVTALVTALVLLPFVLLGSIPGHELVRPAAIVIIGGLVTATLVTLFVTPTIYLRLAASASRRTEEPAQVGSEQGRPDAAP